VEHIGDKYLSPIEQPDASVVRRSAQGQIFGSMVFV
jgi:hypothetical protein